MCVCMYVCMYVCCRWRQEVLDLPTFVSLYWVTKVECALFCAQASHQGSGVEVIGSMPNHQLPLSEWQDGRRGM